MRVCNLKLRQTLCWLLTACVFRVFAVGGCTAKNQSINQQPSFSFHLLAEPHSLDPRQVQGAAGSFLFSQLHRTLYRWQERLVPDGAQKCIWKNPLHLDCQLQPARWSDGSPLTAHDYVRGFRQVLCLKSPHAEHLLNIKGVRKFLRSSTSRSTKKTPKQPVSIKVQNKNKRQYPKNTYPKNTADPKTKTLYFNACQSANLGIEAPHNLTLIFKFDRPDPEFLYKTLSHALSPLKEQAFLKPEQAHRLITSGPYKIKKWVKNKKIYLEKNPYYKTHLKLISNAKSKKQQPITRLKNQQTPYKDSTQSNFLHNTKPTHTTNLKTHTPLVEILFVEDDTAATNLFETGRLHLLRRLPVDDVPRFQQHKNFFTVPLERFDYIGFGPRLAAWPQLMQAMALALDYKALQRILAAPEPLGCPSFSAHFMQPRVCLKFDLKKAQHLLQQVPLKVRQQSYTFVYSKMGGRSVRTSMEWLEHQWKKHLNLRIRLQPLEQGVFLQRLKSQPPDIFRKGGALHRPTCLAALELFKTGAPENYIQLKDKKFEAWLEKLALSARPLRHKQSPGPQKGHNKTHAAPIGTKTQQAHQLHTPPLKTQAQLKTQAKTQAQLCAQAVQHLLGTGQVIPLGRIHYSMLHSGQFKGWSINSLQQLDLRNLVFNAAHKTNSHD